MTGFMKRAERVKAILEDRQPCNVTLIYADGSQEDITWLPIWEKVERVSSRSDIMDVLADDETTRTLLLAIRGPLDFSDLPELEGL